MSLYLGNTPIADGASTALLAGKADVDLTNVNSSGTSLASGWAMPSSRYIDLTLGASGATYTAPASGCVNFVKGANTGQYAVIEILDSSNNVVIKQAGFSQGGNQCVVLLEIKKGSVYKVSYSASGATELFRFIYAEGEN